MFFNPLKQLMGSICLHLIYIPLNGQSPIIDSLTSRLELDLDDSDKIETLLYLTKELKNKAVDKSLHYAQEAAKLSQELNRPKDLAYSNLLTSKILVLKGLVDSALVLSERSYNYALSSNDSLLQVDELYSMAGYFSTLDKKQKH